MKSELKPAAHYVTGDATAIEVWYDGEFVAAVYAANGPGVKVISKHRLDVERVSVGDVIVRVGQ